MEAGLAGLGTVVMIAGLFLGIMTLLLPLIIFLIYGELRNIRHLLEENE